MAGFGDDLTAATKLKMFPASSAETGVQLNTHKSLTSNCLIQNLSGAEVSKSSSGQCPHCGGSDVLLNAFVLTGTGKTENHFIKKMSAGLSGYL